VRVRPRRGLLLNGIFVLVLVPLPIFGTLITLGARTGSWPVAVAGEGLCLVLFAVGLYLFRTTWITVADGHVTERGFFHRPVRTPLSEVHSVVLVRTFSASTAETLPQLIVRNEHGGRILRMRGVFWTEGAMRRTAAAIGHPVDEPTDALSVQQFFDHYSGTAYWFENRRSLAVALIVGIVAACVGVVLGLMALLGLPIAG
jgi:hypothetical protein